MAIRLKVQETKVKLKAGESDFAKLHAHEGIPIYPNHYSGVTEIAPTAERQVLSTSGYMMLENIVVEPIPSNYGLITWDGSTLTVS